MAARLISCFNSSGHFLQTSCERFNLLLLLRNGRFLFRDFGSQAGDSCSSTLRRSYRNSFSNIVFTAS